MDTHKHYIHSGSNVLASFYKIIEAYYYLQTRSFMHFVCDLPIIVYFFQNANSRCAVLDISFRWFPGVFEKKMLNVLRGSPVDINLRIVCFFTKKRDLFLQCPHTVVRSARTICALLFCLSLFFQIEWRKFCLDFKLLL